MGASICTGAAATLLLFASGSASAWEIWPLGTMPSGCDDLGATPPFTEINYETDVQGVFDTHSCWMGGCHDGGHFTGLDLRAGNSIASLVNIVSFFEPGIDRVEPGDALESLLFRKVNCSDPGIGNRMPFGELLSLDQQRLIFDWIEEGAPLQLNGFE